MLLGWLADADELTEAARSHIADEHSTVFVSAATAWEIAIKRALGKLDAPDDLEEQLAAHRFEPLPITVAQALTAGSLPRLHDDPFDRMLIAQARGEGLTIVTADERIARYDVASLHA